MSLLFGALVSVPLQLLSQPNDTLLLDEKTWLAIKPQDTVDTSENDTFAVSVSPSGPVSGHALGIKTLVTWAKLDSSLTSVGVPRKWLRAFPNVFSRASVDLPYTIILVNPVVLTEVILVAESPSALQIARSSPDQVERWFTEKSPFLRKGSSNSFTLDAPKINGHIEDHTTEPSSYKYTVVMTEPVLQGIAVANHTRFIVTAGKGEIHSELDSSLSDSTLLRSAPPSESDDSDYSDLDGIEIDEGFLANSLLGPLHSEQGRSVLNGNNFSESVEGERSETPPATVTFVPRPLDSPLRNEPAGDHIDSEARVFVRTADLGRVGVFSGDWVIVSQANGSNARLARVIADDSMIPYIDRNSLLASPIFLQNIISDVKALPVAIRPSPFGSRAPSLPTAKSVTVARVSSPHASDRAYQPLFLRALKEYFEGTKRLVKKGDLIAVGIRVEDARLLGLGGASGEGGKDDGESNPEQFLDQTFPLAATFPTGVVFFKITNLEYAVLDIAQGAETPSGLGAPDAYFAATMGELGCWVDPQVTQMMQTGSEHSRVTDVSRYLGVYTGYPPCPPISTSDPDSPLVKLVDLVSASLLPSAADYDLHLSVLLKGARGIGKQTTARWVAERLGVHLLEINCFDVVGDSDAKTEGTLRARIDKAANCSPCILLLRHIEALARNSQTLETGKEPAMATILQDCLGDLRKTWKLTGYPVLVFGTTSEPDRIPLGVLSCFKHDISFEAPAEAERLGILSSLLTDASLAPDVNIKSIATQTAALVAADLVDLVARSQAASVQRALKASHETAGKFTEVDAIHAGLVLTGADFDEALGDARASYSESIGAPKIPNVTWDDVGGLASVKSDILDTIQLPLEYPELFADGLKKRSGILLYGPPGTGKTLLAKAVATSCALNFFSVKGPELLNMYIGESEANVRRVFQRARDAKPCVIFFDELDSVAPKRGNHGDSGGVMDRIVSQLLAELDGMADGGKGGGADVFVIGATNRPDLLDSALLRPGRFDRMLYLGVSDTHEAQLNILQALTRKFRLDPELSLNDIAQQCPFNYTGADFYALCSDAMLKSMSRKAQEIDSKIVELNALPPPYEHPHPLTPQYYLAEMATPAEIDVLVSRLDFEQALRELVPSVSQGEMDHYAEVQKKFANDTINAKKDDDDDNDTSDLASSSSSSSDHTQVTAPLISRIDKGKGRAIDV